MKNKITFPHTKSGDEELMSHINHIIEDNAKLDAELLVENMDELIKEEDDKRRLKLMFEMYEAIAVWVIICEFLGKKIANPKHVQHLLDELWIRINKNPELKTSKYEPYNAECYGGKNDGYKKRIKTD